MRSDEGLVHIVFKLGRKTRNGFAAGQTAEGLWAEPVATGRLRLRNTPFFVQGVSAEDVVFAKERGGVLAFAGVSLRGGHSTYWILVTEAGRESWQPYWAPLKKLGCSYEGGGEVHPGRRLLAVDVPPPANIEGVLALFEAGASADVWEFEVGYCAHPR